MAENFLLLLKVVTPLNETGLVREPGHYFKYTR
jgi:hypothetical protein